MNHILQYYHERAQAAYKAADAASDPRDAAAYKAAAQTWESLSKPTIEVTYSMEPHRLQLAALKRDAAEPLPTYDATATSTDQHGMQVEAFVRQPATIEF